MCKMLGWDQPVFPKVVRSPETPTLPGRKCAKAPPASTERGSLQFWLREVLWREEGFGPSSWGEAVGGGDYTSFHYFSGNAQSRCIYSSPSPIPG